MPMVYTKCLPHTRSSGDCCLPGPWQGGPGIKTSGSSHRGSGVRTLQIQTGEGHIPIPHLLAVKSHVTQLPVGSFSFFICRGRDNDGCCLLGSPASSVELYTPAGSPWHFPLGHLGSWKWGLHSVQTGNPSPYSISRSAMYQAEPTSG